MRGLNLGSTEKQNNAASFSTLFFLLTKLIFHSGPRASVSETGFLLFPSQAGSNADQKRQGKLATGQWQTELTGIFIGREILFPDRDAQYTDRGSGVTDPFVSPIESFFFLRFRD